MVLFVCTGNTCRSPMAAALYTYATGKEATSAGVMAHEGAPVSKNAQLVMARMGMDISHHTATPVTEKLVAAADKIITMTDMHKMMLEFKYPKMKDKIEVIGDWAGNDDEVPDPFGGSEEEYKKCADFLLDLIRKAEGL